MIPRQNRVTHAIFFHIFFLLITGMLVVLLEDAGNFCKSF